MQIIDDIDQNTPEWSEFRRGKITGTTTVTAFTGKKYLKDYWGILADTLVQKSEGAESPLDRGHRLEDEAVEKAASKLGAELYHKVGVCVSDKDPRICYSPDRLLKPVDGKFIADIEAKCFEGPAHLQSVIEGYIPDKTQMLRPFTVNPDLQRRHYVFYHDRIAIPELALKIITIERKEYEDEIATLAERDEKALASIDEIVSRYF